jgi:hypothetical protein
MDWAVNPPSGDNAFPNVLTTPTIQVVTPDGNQQITNPLYSYKFHPVDPALQYNPVSLIVHLLLTFFDADNRERSTSPGQRHSAGQLLPNQMHRLKVKSSQLA